MNRKSVEGDSRILGKVKRGPFIAMIGAALLAPGLFDPSVAAAQSAPSETRDPLAEMRKGIPDLVYPTNPQVKDGGYLGKDPQTEAIGSDMFKTFVAAGMLANGEFAEDAKWFKAHNASNRGLPVPDDLALSILEWRAPTSEAIQNMITGFTYPWNGKTITVRANPTFKDILDNPVWHIYSFTNDPSNPDRVRVPHYLYLNAEKANFDPFNVEFLGQLTFFKTRIETINNAAAEAVRKGNTTVESVRAFILQPNVQQEISTRARLAAYQKAIQLEESMAGSPLPWKMSSGYRDRLTQVKNALTIGGEASAIELLTT